MNGLAPGDGIWSDEAEWSALDTTDADAAEAESDAALEQPVLAVVGRPLEPLRLGHKTRKISPGLRRALRIRVLA